MPAAMANLLGDLWAGGEPNWAADARRPGVKLHLYGKLAARAGRKMGHMTALASDGQSAFEAAMKARNALTGPTVARTVRSDTRNPPLFSPSFRWARRPQDRRSFC